MRPPMNVPPQKSAISVSLRVDRRRCAGGHRRSSSASRAASAAKTPARIRRDQALQRRTRREPAAYSCRTEDEDRVACDVDDDLRRGKHQALRKHAAMRGIDELREQRELEHRNLGIEDRCHEAVAKQLDGRYARRRAWRRDRVRRMPGASTRATQGTLRPRSRIVSYATGTAASKRRQPERRGQRMQQESARRTGQRNEACRATLRKRARHEVQHVRPRRGHECDARRARTGARWRAGITGTRSRRAR